VINVIKERFLKEEDKASRKKGPVEESGLVYKVKCSGTILTFTNVDFGFDVPGTMTPW